MSIVSTSPTSKGSTCAALAEGLATPQLLTLDVLESHGISQADVRRRCGPAIEYTALDGRPCWRLEDLGPLFLPLAGHAP
jgi:hypothetical protein